MTAIGLVSPFRSLAAQFQQSFCIEKETTGADITTYTYDASGNRTQKETPLVTTDNTWNEDNKLTKVETVSETIDFFYNADGQRVQKDVDGGTVVKYIYDFQKLLQETGDAGTVEMMYTSTVEEYGDLISGSRPTLFILNPFVLSKGLWGFSLRGNLGSGNLGSEKRRGQVVISDWLEAPRQAGGLQPVE